MTIENLGKIVTVSVLSVFAGLYATWSVSAEETRKDMLEEQRQGTAPATNPPLTAEAEKQLMDMVGVRDPSTADYIKSENTTTFISCSNDQVTKTIVCYERRETK